MVSKITYDGFSILDHTDLNDIFNSKLDSYKIKWLILSFLYFLFHFIHVHVCALV